MTGYDEAVAWFRADPGRVRDLDDVANRSAAITLVNAALAGIARGAPERRDDERYCPQCDSGGHECSGCGTSITHEGGRACAACAAGSLPAMPPEVTEAPAWRVGRKVGRTVYIGDELVGVMDSPELASQVVSAVNAALAAAGAEREEER